MSHDTTHDSHGSVMQRIWIPFFILLFITVVEFAIALLTDWPKSVKTPLYLILTVVKAFYIIAYFMHLKFERVNLIMAISLPIIFLVYLIILLLLEGGHIFTSLHPITAY